MERWTFRWSAAATAAALLVGIGLLAFDGPAAAARAEVAAPDTVAPATRLALTDLSPELGELARAIRSSSDHGDAPFAIVDKRAATVAVFGADGRLVGASPVLLGRTPGDRSKPGVGERTQTRRLREGDRTTPAGRFESSPGRNASGEAVVWVDYDTAFAIHRVRPGATHAGRVRRLAADSVRGRRVSAGCVVVPEAFFDTVVHAVLGHGPGVVYVMPERKDWRSLLPDRLALQPSGGVLERRSHSARSRRAV